MLRQQDPLLFSGSWNREVRWEFYSSNSFPPIKLCTAVFCLSFQNDQLLLVNNPTRGWDVTGGHIETTERNNFLSALKREVFEEGAVSIAEPALIGYRKVISSAPQKIKDGNEYYPHPYSYIPYYIASISAMHDFFPHFETIQRRLFSKDEAMDALQRDFNYKIAEFAYQTKTQCQ